jgi:hypothetical protein
MPLLRAKQGVPSSVLASVLLAMLVITLSGCSKEPNSNSPVEGDRQSIDSPSTPNGDQGGVIGPGGGSGPGGPQDSGGGFAPPLNVGGGGAGGQASLPSAGSVASQLQLPADASTERLSQFLSEADAEFQRLGSTRPSMENRDALVAELKRIAQLKVTAAERLSQDDQASEEMQILAVRARMQGLSHQAALGDIPAAEELERFATSQIDSSSNAIARDSRTVLVGFALERLQTGVTDQPDEVLRFVGDLANRPELLDASSVKAMQQSMAMLSQYGYAEAAEKVRQMIKSSFAESTDPELTELVADVLAAARFNELEAMRAEIMESESASPEQWRAEAEKVAQGGKDLMTLQYLASLALQLEAMEKVDAAKAVYEPIKTYLAGSDDSEVSTAAQEAIDAFATRQSIIGKPFPFPTSNSLSGKPIDTSEYQGRVVLVPYWAVEQMDSLAPLGGIEEIALLRGDKVGILGVNMDVTPAGQEQAKQLASMRMAWPSVSAMQAVPGSDPFTSPLVQGMGIVSLPVVVVVDAEGNVAAISLSPMAVQQAVDRLLP